MSSAVMDIETGVRSLRSLPRHLTTPSVGTMANCLTTSSVGTMANSGSRPVLGVYSTSPSMARSYQLVIVEDTPPTALAIDVEPRRVIGMSDELARFIWLAQSSAEKATLEQTSKIDDEIDTASDIAWLRANLEISMSEIASLFGVTRKAVYDWTNGAKATNASYITSVKSMIDQGLHADLRPYLRQFWGFDEAGGVALLNILKSGDARQLATARCALRALSGPIASYVETIRSRSDETAAPHLHNHDEYRHF